MTSARPDPGLPFVSADRLNELISPDRARDLLRNVLSSGFDVAGDPPRLSVDAGAGHLLIMPSDLDRWVGVKIASVAPGNPALGLERIQAVYLVMDGATLTPSLLIDGTALTALRTPAMTAVAADALADPESSRLLVYGTGPQARAHVRAIAAVRELTSVRLIGRNRDRLLDAVAAISATGIDAQPGSTEDITEADMIVCATSAEVPLFDGRLVRDGAFVAAIGSHEPDRRELDGTLLERSLVVVEDVATALVSSGDVVLARSEGNLRSDDLVSITDVARGRTKRDPDRPNVFKGAGMSWQDLAVAAEVANIELGEP
ncbi:ornithine cyclodeaminase family protein [Tsukamurella asaccharolytica]|uniref:Ornithine cyclodeaminase family protein n=1 Tax=Tsukamurella asaccharolytica TaxID=2592067 RepID=A0A5C5REI9_9ACTN|nr:ornithine cyclodeaminase family protein [Tsukamurella asaccharolytica]TWS21112.1 ornithine cyclodeaminase family protein [Tsukamurella asaccharolytica]